MQVNGKVRDRLRGRRRRSARTSWSRSRARSERVQAHLNGRELRKTIVVPGKLVNFVV